MYLFVNTRLYFHQKIEFGKKIKIKTKRFISNWVSKR